MTDTPSPLVVSKFDDTRTLFASVIIALDRHQVNVVSVSQTESDLNSSLTLESDNKVSILSWIPFHDDTQILGIALTNGSVLLYSPATNTVVSRLTTSNNSLITDFKYSPITKTLWASDIAGTIYEWDTNYTLIQKFSINDSLELETTEPLYSITVINYESQPHILAGSHSIYLVNIQTKDILKTFPGHIQPVKEIRTIPFDNDLFMSCATGDRFINLYSITKQSTKSVFVTGSPVLDVDIAVIDDKSVLVARTDAGIVEVFNSFLNEDVAVLSQTNSRKKKRQQLANARSRHADGSISLIKHSDDLKGSSSSYLPIVSASVNQSSVIYTWLENSTVAVFDSSRWLNESGQPIIKDPLNLTKKKQSLPVAHHALNGHDVASAKQYNEGNAIVSDGYNLNNVVEEDDDDEDGETLADKLSKLANDAKTTSNKKTKKTALGNNNTLTTILAQSLKNNDHALLETVLLNRDQQVIQNTIARLDASLAVVLLDRLSERLARQANRFDQLVYWLKWIIIVHGGILSSLPSLASKLSNLHGLLSRKADTLPTLLQLQNKMQIINEQYDLNRANNGIIDEADEESDIEYIEELEDAELDGNGDDSERDDYVESDVSDIEMEESEDDVRPTTEDLEVDEDEDGYSDEEVVPNKVIDSE